MEGGGGSPHKIGPKKSKLKFLISIVILLLSNFTVFEPHIAISTASIERLIDLKWVKV